MITYTLAGGPARRMPWSSAQVSNATPRVEYVTVPGDVPDHRGRTGLDQVGRDLTGNRDVEDVELGAARPLQELARFFARAM